MLIALTVGVVLLVGWAMGPAGAVLVLVESFKRPEWPNQGERSG
jgi:hypothetical protein